MGTEHQQYSVANQSAAIALYNAANGMGIVRSYVDAGKSGLSIQGRKALQELIRTVEADFEYILVYDVSRWGRFLDADKSAHYEYVCKRAGVHIRYCAEQFANDNATTSGYMHCYRREISSFCQRLLFDKIPANVAVKVRYQAVATAEAVGGVRHRPPTRNSRQKSSHTSNSKIC